MSLASQYTQGMGGLKFVATAPPGQGRLIRIPFYLETGVLGFDAQAVGAAAAATQGGTGTASTTSPVIFASCPNAAGIGNVAILKTPQISWATLRIVGFEVSENVGYTQTIGGKATLLCKDLQIGGGANLFVHSDYGNTAIYASSNDSFAGLRDYPLLKSPNVAEVSVTVQAATAGGAAPLVDNSIGMAMSPLFTCNLVCEILQDDQYGSHVPGPYARKIAMQRSGGSFV